MRKTKHIKDKYTILIAKEFGINKDWIETGKGDFRIDEYDQMLNDTSVISDALSSYGNKIPFRKDGFDNKNSRYINLPNDIINFKGKDIEALRIDDESMSTTIEKRDIIFIDKNSTSIQNGKIYFVTIKNEDSLKRLFTNPNNENIILKSDNPLYPQIELLKDEFSIIGRAVANISIKEL